MNENQISTEIESVLIRSLKNSGSMNTSEGNNLIIGDDMLLEKDFGFDSLDFVELIGDLEEKFNIEIEDNFASKIHTVKDLKNYVCTLKRQK